MVMGVEGEGNITLAPGLEDVSVAFRRRRRVNWRPTGRRNRRGGRRAGANGGGNDVDGGSSGSDERESDSDLESSGDDDDGGAGDADSDFEVEAGDDGNSGKGNEHGVVVGDMLRVWWVAEQVWFRCRVEGMGREGHTVRVAYLVDDRWGTFVHALADVEWERWAPGGQIDPAEADYDMDVWVPEEEVDREAAAAAAEGSRRRGVSRGDGGETASRGRAGSTPPRAGGGDESEAEEDVEGARAACDGGATSSSTTCAPVSQFGWVVKAVPKGKGLQKRKRLLTALVGLWDATPASDEGDLPVAMKRAVYKAMAGVMTPKQVAAELGALAKAGLVTASGDEVRCSEARGGADAGSARSRCRASGAEAGGQRGGGGGGEGGAAPAGKWHGRGREGAATRVGLGGGHGLARGSDDALRRSTRNRSRSRTGAMLGIGTRVEDGQARGWSTAYGTWEPTSGGEGGTGDAQGGTALAREIEEVWTARR